MRCLCIGMGCREALPGRLPWAHNLKRPIAKLPFLPHDTEHTASMPWSRADVLNPRILNYEMTMPYACVDIAAREPWSCRSRQIHRLNTTRSPTIHRSDSAPPRHETPSHCTALLVRAWPAHDLVCMYSVHVACDARGSASLRPTLFHRSGLPVSDQHSPGPPVSARTPAGVERA